MLWLACCASVVLLQFQCLAIAFAWLMDSRTGLVGAFRGQEQVRSLRISVFALLQDPVTCSVQVQQLLCHDLEIVTVVYRCLTHAVGPLVS
jgi:hypothetical protein